MAHACMCSMCAGSCCLWACALVRHVWAEVLNARRAHEQCARVCVNACARACVRAGSRCLCTQTRCLERMPGRRSRPSTRPTECSRTPPSWCAAQEREGGVRATQYCPVTRAAEQVQGGPQHLSPTSKKEQCLLGTQGWLVVKGITVPRGGGRPQTCT